jgi:hypothetical protein
MKALGKGSIASFMKGALTVAWWALWICAALLGVAAVGYGIILILIANGTIDATLLTGGEGEIRVGGGEGDFNLTYDDAGGATWPVVVPAFLIGAVLISGYLVIVGRLRRLFDGFSSGEAFRRENAQHLRVMWIALLAMEIARYALMTLAGVLITVFEPDVQASVDFTINLTTWASILILIVLAEVFREGARLKEEQELTI